MTVEVEELGFSYDNGRTYVLEDLSFVARPGELTTLIGANGAGKTTTLKCIAGLYTYKGTVRYNEKEIKRSDLIEKLSYMEQNTDCTINLNVFTIVLLGLVQDLGYKILQEDIDRVNDVLDLVGIRHLASRRIGEISGGQRQLAFLAQALIKNPEILLLDEPTGALDLYHQIKLMKFVKEIVEKRQCVAIMTLHHLDMAMKYSDNVVVIHDGGVYSEGKPTEVFTEKMLHDVYKVNVKIVTDSSGDRYMHIKNSIDQEMFN